jgi:hypothetical protein
LTRILSEDDVSQPVIETTGIRVILSNGNDGSTYTSISEGIFCPIDQARADTAIAKLSLDSEGLQISRGYPNIKLGPSEAELDEYLPHNLPANLRHE